MIPRRIFPKRLGLAAVVAAVALAVGVSWSQVPAAEKKPAPSLIGRPIADFSLPDVKGKPVSLADYRQKPVLVAIFVGTECPLANLYLPELMDLQKRYASKGVETILINANEGDSADAIKEHAEKFKVSLPLLRDADQRVADLFGAKRTPEVFVLDAKRTVRYHGRIDDRYGYQYRRDTPLRDDLGEALKELTSGKQVSVKETEVIGCFISRHERADRGEPVTYAKQVSRIVQNKCQTCHRPGTVAPFSLTTYKDAKAWADTIKEVVLEKRMPPWHADARYGKFTNERSLSQQEIDTVVSWVDHGMPMGDEKDLPPAKEYAEGWMIGKPDVVFELPQEVTIPAGGTVPYQYYMTPTNFKEDMWVQAAEARPGNRKVVHHIILFFRDPNAQREDRGNPFGNGFLCGTAPGDMPLILSPGVARKIPAGAILVWQMHYTPTGKVEKDRSQVGLIFSRQKPERLAITRGVSNRRFHLPPGESNYRVESEFTFPRDAILMSFMPHMHLRGKDFEYRAIYPDGREEVLLSVPRYDFNWQSYYHLAEPKRLPRGTKLHCVAHFDNSTGNAANPDPTEEVRWGDQTWEEMMIGWIDYTWERPMSETVAAQE